MSWFNRPSLGPGAYPRGGDMETVLDEIELRDIIGWANRGGNSSGFVAETAVLRVDNIPVRAGRSYLVLCPPIHIFSTVANDDIAGNLRYTVDGTAATTASTVIHSDTSKVSGASVDRGGSVAPFGMVVPNADAVMSVLLSGSRINGGGSGSLLAPMNIFVIAYGDAVADTGVDL